MISGKSCSKCRVHWKFNASKTTRPQFVTWRNKVTSRDQVCQKCGSADQLHAHHILAYADYPEYANDPNNGITFCKVCHDSLHKLYGYSVGLENLQLALGRELNIPPPVHVVKRASTVQQGRKYTEQEVQTICTSHGMVYLNNYEQIRKPMLVGCRCGNTGLVSLMKIQTGQGCGNCAEFRWRDKFKEFNCLVIEYTSASNVTYECACGNVVEHIQAANWLKGDKLCQNCS